MAKKTNRLKWCIVRLGADMNWWVEKTSDPVHWDSIDSLSILDPRQIHYVSDNLYVLKAYGLDLAILDRAFYPFAIGKENEKNSIYLEAVNKESLLNNSDEYLFALPDLIDDENGPYADFVHQIIKARVKMLNDLIDFEEEFTIEELEEALREDQNEQYLEGKAVHIFSELNFILEYVPEGYELHEAVEETNKEDLEEDLEGFESAEEDEEDLDLDIDYDEDDEDMGDDFSEDAPRRPEPTLPKKKGTPKKR